MAASTVSGRQSGVAPEVYTRCFDAILHIATGLAVLKLSSHCSQEEAYLSSGIREGEIDMDVRYTSPPLCLTAYLH